MKKIYALFACTIFSLPVFAQLNGSYQIGGTAPDYPTLSAAVNALDLQGVSGSVKFNIEPGTYNEQVVIPHITGTSRNDTILFTSSTGNSNDVTIEFDPTSQDNYIIQIDSSSHLNFKNLKFNALGNDYGQVIQIKNASNNIRVVGSEFQGISNGNSHPRSIIVRDEDANPTHPNQDIYVINNTFSGGNSQVKIESSGIAPTKYVEIRGNTFINPKVYGIKVRGIDDAFTSNKEAALIIKNNRIRFDKEGYSTGGVTGISANAVEDSMNISGNIISGYKGGGTYHEYRGIETVHCNGTPSRPLWVYNNIIDLNIFWKGGVGGIYIGDGTYSKFFHNTISVTGTGHTASRDFGIQIWEISDIQVKNNDVQNHSPDSNSYVVATKYSTLLSSGLTMNNNSLYGEGEHFAYWGGSLVANFEDYQDSTGYDANSLNQRSGVTISDSWNVDLCSYGLYGYGVPTSIDKDITGEARSTTSPTIGAIENFNSSPSVNALAASIEKCEYEDDTLYGDSYQNGNYMWIFGTDTLGTKREKIFTVSDTSGYYHLKWDNGECFAQDSIYITGNPLPDISLVEDTGFCSGEEVVLDPGEWSVYSWAGGSTDPTLSVDSAGGYWVRVTDTNGCQNVEGVDVFEWPLPAIDSMNTQDATCSTCCDGEGIVHTPDSIPLDFQWTSGATNDTVTDLCVGQVIVTVTDSNGCVMTDTAVIDYTVGQEELNLSSGMTLFPNPSQGGMVKLKVDGNQDQAFQGRVLDLKGREIKAFQLPAGTRGHELDLPKDASGVYYFELFNEHQVMMEKLIIE